MQYLQPFIDDETVVTVLKEKIATQSPFCLSRLGDGEIFLLNNNASSTLIEKIKKAWCVDDYHKFRDSVVRDILEPTIKYTDLLGLLSPSSPVCKLIKYDQATWSIKKSYVKSIKGTKEIDVCDHQVPRGRDLGDVNRFKEILDGKSLSIISPNIELLNKPLAELLQADVTVTIVSNDRQDLLEKIDKIKEPVVIYGTSLTGKDIGVRLKAKGKVCIDYGATLDAWANIGSRKWFSDNGLQSHCVIKG